MSKAIYIATTGPHSGKSLVSIGLMHTLLWSTGRVGYFRPIIDDIEDHPIDNHLSTMLGHFELDLSYDEAHVFTRSIALQMINNGDRDELFNTIIDKYRSLEPGYDFIIIEGSDFSDMSSILEWDINVTIAQNLSAPVIIVANAEKKPIDDIISNMTSAYHSFNQKEIPVLQLVANKSEPTAIEEIETVLQELTNPEVLVTAIPVIPKLNNPSIFEINKAVNGEILFGEDQLSNPVGSFTIGAMHLNNYLTHLSDDALIVTPGDRFDIILGALQANLSENYPSVSGIVLTGGLKPSPPINRLIDGLAYKVPILSVQKGTFLTANKVANIKAEIYQEHKDKIDLSIDLFEKYISEEILIDRLIAFKPKGLSPKMFLYDLLKRAKADKKNIVLPEGMDTRILEASAVLLKKGAVDITLLGDRKKIKEQIDKNNIDLNLEEIDIINPIESTYFQDYIDTLYKLRKHKGITKTIARDLMQDVSYFGTMMVHQGHADGMVSGAIHSTQHTIRPALQFIKTTPGTSVASSVFFMCLEDRVMVYGDCAINANPTPTQLAQIAISSADTSLAFGIVPKIAMLSYSSGSSGKGHDVDAVRAATDIVNTKRPELIIEGPIQYDAAMDPAVGKIKLPESEVAGEANVFIFPDLNSGNNTYKAVQRETNTLAIGPIIQGLNKPINDLSRGCTVDDIINTVIITVIQAQLN